MKALVLAALLVVGCGAAASPARSLTGSMTLNAGGSGITIEGPVGSITGCHGEGGYSDMVPGAAVVVRDQAGTIIATGNLGPGKYSAGVKTPFACRFAFAIPNLPDATFYAVEVSHRGAITYSKADLESRGWVVELTLGG